MSKYKRRFRKGRAAPERVGRVSPGLHLAGQINIDGGQDAEDPRSKLISGARCDPMLEGDGRATEPRKDRRGAKPAHVFAAIRPSLIGRR